MLARVETGIAQEPRAPDMAATRGSSGIGRPHSFRDTGPFICQPAGVGQPPPAPRLLRPEQAGTRFSVSTQPRRATLAQCVKGRRHVPQNGIGVNLRPTTVGMGHLERHL